MWHHGETNPHFWPIDEQQQPQSSPPPRRPRADQQPPRRSREDQPPPRRSREDQPPPRRPWTVQPPPPPQPLADQPSDQFPPRIKTRSRNRRDHVHFQPEPSGFPQPSSPPHHPSYQPTSPPNRPSYHPHLELGPSYHPHQVPQPTHDQPPHLPEPIPQPPRGPTRPPPHAIEPIHDFLPPKPTHTGGSPRRSSKPSQPQAQWPLSGPGSRHDFEPARRQNLHYPSPDRTNPLTWFAAVFCTILWIVIILGGLLVLIIYLVYRPRTPEFQISEGSLNAAYLDVGAHLNLDLTLLANFTNLNQKMRVDINFVTLKLYYLNHLIANHYLQPFSADRRESRLAVIEMIGSQVRLPMVAAQQLVRQIQSNKVTFQVVGLFHARTNFGIYKYSYMMNSQCSIITGGPPSGIMVNSTIYEISMRVIHTLDGPILQAEVISELP